MAYFDDANDTTFYPSFSNFAQFDAYPTLGQTSATEEEGVTTLDTFAHGWGVSGQPGHMVGFPQSLRPEAGFGEYGYSPLDNMRLTQVSRIGDPGHLIRPSRPGL